MKKFLLLIAIVIGVSTAAMAKDIYGHDASVLPEAARTTIANNCKAEVSVVKIEKDFGRISEYEVVLTDGTEITFDRNGNWKDVETNKAASVPAGFIPQAISDFVAKNHQGTNIVGIDKERYGYEVELSNGVDIKFDKNGRFMRYDD